MPEATRALPHWAWFKAGLHPAMNHACLSTILPLPNCPLLGTSLVLVGGRI